LGDMKGLAYFVAHIRKIWINLQKTSHKSLAGMHCYLVCIILGARGFKFVQMEFLGSGRFNFVQIKSVGSQIVMP